MSIEKPLSIYEKPNCDLTQIKDRLGKVIAVCNDPQIATFLVDQINSCAPLDDVREKFMDEIFT